VWCLFRTMREACNDTIPAAREGGFGRDSMTTWGILALAVFVSLGMAEWSKRMAAGEMVIDPAVKMEDRARVNVNVNVNESGKRSSFAANPLRGSATEGFTIQTSAGVEQ